jgi:hypothetical protein
MIEGGGFDRLVFMAAMAPHRFISTRLGRAEWRPDIDATDCSACAMADRSPAKPEDE